MASKKRKFANPLATISVREYEQGLQIEEIASKHRVSVVDVYNWIREHGCVPKGRYAVLGKKFPALTEEQAKAMLKEQTELIEAENAYLRDAIQKMKEEPPPDT